MPGELRIYSKTCLLKAGEGLRGCTVNARKSLPGYVQVEEVLAAHRQKKNGWWGRACEGVEGLSLQQQWGG